MHGSAEITAGDDVIIDGRHRYTVLETRIELHPNGWRLMLRVDHQANGVKYPQWIGALRAEPINPRLPL